MAIYCKCLNKSHKLHFKSDIASPGFNSFLPICLTMCYIANSIKKGHSSCRLHLTGRIAIHIDSIILNLKDMTKFNCEAITVGYNQTLRPSCIE